MKKLLLSVFCILSGLFSHAADDYKFRTLSPRGGFYYDHVKSILQDRSGFMWIVMDNNLLRFDGYEYKSYYPHFKSFNVSSKWYFADIAMNSTGDLYVGTNHGLYRLDTETDSFENLCTTDILSLCIDRQDTIWINRAIFDRQSGDLLPLELNGKSLLGFGILYPYDDYVLVVYQGNIYQYDHRDKTLSPFFSLPRNESIAGIDRQGDKFWVLTANQTIYRVDLTTQALEEQYDINLSKDGRNVPVRAIKADKNGRIWIGSLNGLLVLDPETKAYRVYHHAPNQIFTLPNNSIRTLTEDTQGNMWIGTYSGGLCYVNLDESDKFTRYTPQESLLNHSLVSGFAEDKRYLWIGTEGGGINRLDKITGEFSYLLHAANENSPASNNVKSLVLDRGGRLWISMFRGGLDCYDTTTGRFRHFRRENNNPKSLLSNDLRKIIPEGDLGLWIAYQQQAAVISFFSFETGDCTHYYLDNHDPKYYIFDLHRGNGDDLWVVSAMKLYRLNVRDLSIRIISSDQFSFLDAQTVCTDRDDNLWIGTVGNGLLRYDTRTSEFTVFNEILRYNTSNIYSMCFDDGNRLWLGTQNGLFLYDPAGNTYHRFEENDGIQGEVHYPLSCMKSTTGRLYFGGTNGFTVVNPENILYNQTRPRVILSGFLVDNTPALPSYRRERDTDGENRIELNHHQANFGFKFSSDNYLIPEKNTFRYRLKGYDDHWITVDASNRTALYSKVPPGNYLFEIAAANNDGVWGDTLYVPIVRRPAPWLSWWAYLIYAFLGCAIAGVILYYYIDKKKLKMQLYLSNLDQQKKEEIHESQLRFFTNISHDFRTPLTLILSTVDNLKQEGLDAYYHRILHSNTHRLLNLVNEVMDFRKVQHGKMELNVRPVPVNRFIQLLVADFEQYAGRKNIRYRLDCDPGLSQPIPIDKPVFEKIIINLVNNAFKYTACGGEITIETYAEAGGFVPRFGDSFTVRSDRVPTDVFLVVIRDSGIGISKESIASVFERFYKVKTINTDAHLGTGIGLALVKSLVMLHKGAITIYSQREKGTDIVVALPRTLSVYSEEEIFREETSDENPACENPEPASAPESFRPDEAADLLLREKKRILLAEDNDDLREMIVRFLSPHYEIREARNGAEAADFLVENDTDLILSDILMPVKDGVTLCREIKNNINTSHIPFVLLTARTGLESQLEGYDSGADLYFEKPLDLNLLSLSIQNIFKQQSNLREYYAKNYYAESTELSANEQDNIFLKKLIEIIDRNLGQPIIDVNFIASELSMSRSKLYAKLKALTDKSIVEFILNYRLRKAARLIIERNLSIQQVMVEVGIKSQSYFTNVFKKEFGDTPAVFAQKHKGRKK